MITIAELNSEELEDYVYFYQLAMMFFFQNSFYNKTKENANKDMDKAHDYADETALTCISILRNYRFDNLSITTAEINELVLFLGLKIYFENREINYNTINEIIYNEIFPKHSFKTYEDCNLENRKIILSKVLGINNETNKK